MSEFRNRRSIKHPEWILDALESLSRTAALYSRRRIPESIEVPMIVVPVKRVLRGVYGSDLAAAAFLLRAAIAELGRYYAHSLKEFWLFSICRKDRDEYYAKALAELRDGAKERRSA